MLLTKSVTISEHLTEEEARQILNEYLTRYSTTEDFLLGLVAHAFEEGCRNGRDE